MRRFARSLRCAIRGIVLLVRGEVNARIHLVLLAGAVLVGIVLRLSPLEWALVVLASGLVLALEAMNTAVEHLCDRVHPERSDAIRAVKDLAAGGVLFGAVAAALVGLIIVVGRLAG